MGPPSDMEYPYPPLDPMNPPHAAADSSAPASQQYYPPPPPHAAADFAAPASQQYYPPPPPHAAADSSAPTSQQYYPPPPPHQAAAYSPGAVPPPMPPRPTSFQAPPQRQGMNFGDDDPSNPIHYARDPHKLVAYLVPFPKPVIKGLDSSTIPDRFLVYTPPPPPLSMPKEGEKEDKLHKVQRKWQAEVRAAKQSDAKVNSWKGVKGRATKGINWAMSKTTTSNLDFVNRIPIPGSSSKSKSRSASPSPGHDSHADDGVHEDDHTHKTVELEEMVLVYPTSHHATPDQVKEEFINTMMRTRSKAQRDSIIATGLLPVSAGIDIAATLIWPFGGLLEIDSVWAYSSIRGAKTARSVTKRLNSSNTNAAGMQQAEQDENKLKLTFTQSPRLELLSRYLIGRCVHVDDQMFRQAGGAIAPAENEVLSAIGWAPSTEGGGEKNWEDEQWEREEVRDDMKNTLGKAAKEWGKWCKAFAKNPQKAEKK